jgi:hypothetical protein
MVRVVLELDDEVFARLKARAEGEQTSVEALIGALASEGAVTTESEPSAEFMELVERQSERYARLFSRLAE